MYYGGLDTDFSGFANLADASISKLAVVGVDPQPINQPDRFWDYVPKEGRFNDKVLHLAEPGGYQANAWGLFDMIGNVARVDGRHVSSRIRTARLPWTWRRASKDAKAVPRRVVVRTAEGIARLLAPGLSGLAARVQRRLPRCGARRTGVWP